MKPSLQLAAGFSAKGLEPSSLVEVKVASLSELIASSHVHLHESTCLPT
jgi:hypothetical protein